jgi:branched-chain amino acid transport system substrate-binding protein
MKIAVLLCAVATTVAACGSSSNSSSTGSAAPATGASSAASTPSAVPTGAAFELGAICSCSGAQAAALGRLKDVGEAWAKSVNDAGGLNGHPVKLTVKDDGGDPAKALAAAKELIESAHVQAIVGDSSLADAAFEKYVSGKGVPVIGGLAPSAPFITNPNWFTGGAGLPVSTVGTMALAKAAGAKTVGVMYCSETPLCKQVDAIGKGAAALNGLGYDSTSVAGTSPSFAAPCLKLKGAGVDAMFIASNGQIVKRITDQCAQQGYKFLTASQTNTADPGWLPDPVFEGAVLASSDAPYTDATIPGVKKFLDAMDKYVPGMQDGEQFSYDTIYPWVAGKLFEAAAKAGKLSPTSTSADIKKGLYALKGETLDGLAPPLTFAPGKPGFPTCYFSVTVKGGKFVSANGGKPTCLSAAQAKGLGAALAKLG